MPRAFDIVSTLDTIAVRTQAMALTTPVPTALPTSHAFALVPLWLRFTVIY